MGVFLGLWHARHHKLLAGLMCVLVVAACVTGPRRPDASEYPREASHAIPFDTPSALRRAMAPDYAAHPGQSGFRLLPNGEDSLRMRLALVLAAEKTLDLQYYAMHDDDAANLMLEAILLAAERGVRVRFLIDNISLNDVEKSLSLLDSNKNIQVRVFNPIATRDMGLFGWMNALIVDIDKALKRMHNKALIADNQLSIIGGRNIGDEYFDARPDTNFEDMDLLSAGPITARISHSFDDYWNSDESFPIRALRQRDRNPFALDKLRRQMRAAWAKEMAREKGDGMLSAVLAKQLEDGAIPFHWAKAELTVDEPEKVNKDATISDSKTLSRLLDLLSTAEHEFVAVSPYFVPGERGVAALKALVDRGISVRILTNSLASTDVVAVHTGYRRYREDVVRAGVALYEFKPVGGRPRQRLFGSSAPPQASLHSKMFVIDRRDVVIGSYNLDPRSTELNTEIAVVIHSKALAEEVLGIFERSISPEKSYRIVLAKGGVEWHGADDKGRSAVFRREPGAGIVRNAEVAVFSLLPIEDQL